MAKSLTSILSQIERLQKEANAIQSEVIARVRKDIVKFGLTAEQLFGTPASTPSRRLKSADAKTGRGSKSTKSVKTPKYADGGGNTWGGIGKRPEWLRQALAAGHALDDFLIGKINAAAPAEVKPAKPADKVKAERTARPAQARKSVAKKRTSPKSPSARKPRVKKSPAVAVA